MKITVYPATGSPVDLTGSSLEETVEGLEGPCEWVAQPRQAIGADQLPQALDLGNASNTVAFMVTRSHDSAQDANMFYLDHPGSVPHLGLVEMQVISSYGDVLARRIIAAATIKVARVRWNVCQTIMKYTITGGKITSS